MPTFDVLDRFWRDFDALNPEQQAAFLQAVRDLAEDLKRGQGFRKGLRVKGVKGHPRICEMTWAGDGRATFPFGTSPRSGDVHIIWRRIGTHDIFKKP